MQLNEITLPPPFFIHVIVLLHSNLSLQILQAYGREVIVMRHSGICKSIVVMDLYLSFTNVG